MTSYHGYTHKLNATVCLVAWLPMQRVFRCLDLITPIEIPHGGAAIKVYDVSITDRRLVVQGFQLMKTKCVTTLPPDDRTAACILLTVRKSLRTTKQNMAILNDYAGTKAVELFVNSHPTAAACNFNNIVAMVILHAPTIVPLTSNLGYSNALATTSSISAFVAPKSEVALRSRNATAPLLL
eukprot:gene32614-42240_t